MKQADNILIVDDEPMIRDLFRRHLKEEGFYPLEAQDGFEALDILRKHSDVGVILLDIRLPQLSGLEVYDLLRKEFPQIKIIVSSVYPKEEQEFLISGVDDYYYKSEGLCSLTDKIRKLQKDSELSGHHTNRLCAQAQEKRRCGRLPVKVIAECKKSEDIFNYQRRFLSFTRDISMRGLRMVSPGEIRVGEHIAMALELPDYFMPLLVYGEVKWVKTRDGANNKIESVTEAGVSFTRMEFSDAKRLHNYLQ